MDDLVLVRETVAAESRDIAEGLPLIRVLVVTSDPEQEFAAEILRDVKGRHHFLEEKRKTVSVPLNTALRELNAMFKPALSNLEEGERLLKSKIAGYLQQKEDANRKALAAAAAAATPEAAEQALATVADVQAPAGVGVRYVWKFQVIAPDMVPAEFLSPDVEKIKQAIAASAERGEPEPIPGVRIFKEPVVSARRSP